MPGTVPRTQPSPAHSSTSAPAVSASCLRAASATRPSETCWPCLTAKRDTIAPGGTAMRKSPVTVVLPALKKVVCVSVSASSRVIVARTSWARRVSGDPPSPANAPSGAWPQSSPTALRGAPLAPLASKGAAIPPVQSSQPRSGATDTLPPARVAVSPSLTRVSPPVAVRTVISPAAT